MNKSCAAQRLVLDWRVFIVFWKVGSFKLFIYLHQTGTPFSFSQFYPLLLSLAYFLNFRESKRDFWLFLPGRSLASRTDGRTEQITKREKEREKPIWRHKETEKLSLLFLRADTDARVRVIYAAIFPNQWSFARPMGTCLSPMDESRPAGLHYKD